MMISMRLLSYYVVLLIYDASPFNLAAIEQFDSVVMQLPVCSATNVVLKYVTEHEAEFSCM